MDFSAIIRPEQMPLLAFASASIVGIVAQIKGTFPQVKGIWAFSVAVAIGVTAGLLGLYHMTVELGLLAALVGSGVYTVATKAGGN